ncbi:MAG: polysaccharide biosynthesis tyrosine autokinase [Candidatus Bathyarchaeota archaeon]|nr:polysaccharide biosynthesis tyrosine autokinase [Candidatus Bathyarchaeota archaeon]
MSAHKKISGGRVEKFRFKEEVGKYLKYWPWFSVSIILFLSLGYLHLRYTTPLYSAKATIIIKGESSGGGVASSIYEELGMNGMGASNYDTEIGILKSRRLMEQVVKSLNLQVRYFQEGKIRTMEMYEAIPFTIQILSLDDEQLKKLGGVTIEISENNEGFLLKNSKTGEARQISSGTPVDLQFADLVIKKKSEPTYESFSNTTIVNFSNVEKIASAYSSNLNIIQEAQSSGLIHLEMKDPLKQKASDILDQLILEYNRDAIEDKNLIAGNTANFINERLSIINGELDSVETGKESFKEDNRLTDIQAQSQLYIQNANEYNKRRQEVGTQLELSKAMLEYISSNSKLDLLPTNLGISESGVNQQINEYNNLVLERNRILGGSSEKNPVVIRLNNKIDQIKNNITRSLKTLHSNLQIGLEDLERQSSSIGSQIYAVPSKERRYRGIERQQNIKETLYLFLLQKREENSLSLAVTEPKAKIVDRAHAQDWPVSPNSRNIYLGTFILGLFIPFSIIYIKDNLDNKIRRKKDLDYFEGNCTLVGGIPKVRKKADRLIGNHDRSILAESFRILITTLQYLLINKKDKSEGVILLITSSITGEGKTFVAVNLALTLANTGKRVLLFGADLRNPSLQPYKSNNNDLGISDYLINDELCLKDLIGPSNIHPDLEIITSGHIPPNPYELLRQDKFGDIFPVLKLQYDYIVIDSAPSIPVADTFLITKYSDLVLYVLRSGYTDKEVLEFILKSQEEGKFEGINFVLNDLKSTGRGYGNKYGYGYESIKKSKSLIDKINN